MPAARPQCGNPLFLEWIEELRDQAKEKGLKVQDVYAKAARSLAACPVPYPRPRDLVVLNGIGTKTVQILETKWKKHCEENGIPLMATPPRRPVQRKKPSADPTDPDLDQGTGSEADSPPPPKKRKSAKPKTYIPQRGSGGYGILLGLLLAIDRPEIDTQVFLTRSELVRAAQPFSDVSYDHPEKGTYFTAWSSMKTLIGKGYVYMTGNPHKYCLTEEGYDVACAIRALLPEYSHMEKYPFLHTPADLSGVHSRQALQPVRQAITSKRTLSESSDMVQRRTSAGKFQFWYIDAGGHFTDDMRSAVVRLDPDDFIPLRKIEFLQSQKSHPFVTQLRMVGPSSRDPSTLYGFVDEESAPPKCSRFDTASIKDTLDIEPRPKISRSATEVTMPLHKSLPLTPLMSLPVDTVSFDTTVSPGPKNGNHVLPLTPRRRPRLSAHVQPLHPLAEPLQQPDPSSLPSFDPSDALVFPAGSYEIILILDTREIESKTNRDMIAAKLGDKGVKVETRALRLGDVCWIAKRLDGLGGEEDECVLDYVLERKRMDDLCASIRDGRYQEQCFRLGNSGIGNVFYLVEDWHTSHHMEYSGQQIMTAKSQIQVHNCFILKETHKLSESIDFLATMTAIIKSTLASRDIHIIPSTYVSRPSYLGLKSYLKTVNPTRTYHTSFQTYQDLNDKSASTTVRDKFARMLLCVKGMSAERVSAVLDEFETPREMWEAMKRRVEMEGVEDSAGEEEEEEDKSLGPEQSLNSVADGIAKAKGKSKAKGKAKHRGPELFFADRVRGEGRRKIGDALSRDLWKVFMTKT